jgi:polysaccharide export outer membrane protein
VTRGTALLILLLGTAATAQEPDLNTRIQQMSVLGAPTGDYHLGPGDVVTISVFGVAGYNHDVRVSSAGTVRLPLIESVAAAGLTPSELEAALEMALGAGIIREPDVTVTVKEYRSQSVFVLGMVKRPGEYQISRPLRLIDVLSMAGGIEPTAGTEIVVQRGKGSDDEPQKVIRIDLMALLDRGDVSLNVPMAAGDVVNVPERIIRTFYVIGEVNIAGAFELPQGRELLVTQAIARAGGPMRTAKLGDGILVRQSAQGTRQELRVDFDAILKGKKPDFLVQADDIVFIPGSQIKNIAYGLLGVVPNTVSRLPSGFR